MVKSKASPHSIGVPPPPTASSFDDSFIYAPSALSPRRQVRWIRPFLTQYDTKGERLHSEQQQFAHLHAARSPVFPVQKKRVKQHAMNSATDSITKQGVTDRDKVTISKKNKAMIHKEPMLVVSSWISIHRQSVESKLNAFKLELAKWIHSEQSQRESVDAMNQRMKIKIQKMEKEQCQRDEDLHKMESKYKKVKSRLASITAGNMQSDRPQMGEYHRESGNVTIGESESKMRSEYERLSNELQSMTKSFNVEIDTLFHALGGTQSIPQRKEHNVSPKSGQSQKRDPVILKMMIKDLKLKNDSQETLLNEYQMKMDELKRSNEEIQKELEMNRELMSLQQKGNAENLEGMKTSARVNILMEQNKELLHKMHCKEEQSTAIITKIESEKMTLMEEMESMKVKLAESQRENESHQQYLEQRESEWKEERHSFEAKIEEYTELKERHEITVKDFQKLKEKTASRRNSFSKLIKGLKLRVRNSKQEHQALQKELVPISQRNLEKTLTHFQDESQETINKLCIEFREKVDEFNEQIDVQTQKMTDKYDWTIGRLLPRLKDAMNLHSRSLLHLKEKNNILCVRLNEVRTQKQTQFDEMKGEIDDLLQQKKVFIQDMRLKVQSTATFIETLESEKKEMRESLDSMKMKLTESQQEVEELKEDRRCLETNAESFKEIMEELHVELAESQNVGDQLQQELESMHQKSIRSDSKRKEKYVALKSKLYGFKEMMQKHENTIGNLLSHWKEVMNLHRGFSLKMKEENHNLSIRVDELQKSERSLLKQIENLRASEKKALSELQSIKEDETQIRDEMNEDRRCLEMQSEAFREIMAELHEELAVVQGERNSLQAELATAHGDSIGWEIKRNEEYVALKSKLNGFNELISVRTQEMMDKYGATIGNLLPHWKEAMRLHFGFVLKTKEQNHNLCVRVDELQKGEQSLLEQIDHLRVSKETALGKLQSIQEQDTQIRNESKKSEAELHTLKLQCKVWCKEISNARNGVTEMRAEYNELRKELVWVETANKSVMQELESMEKQSAALKDSMDKRKEKARAVIQEKHEKIKTLVSERNMLKSLVKTLHAETTLLKQRLNKCTEEMKVLESHDRITQDVLDKFSIDSDESTEHHYWKTQSLKIIQQFLSTIAEHNQHKD